MKIMCKIFICIFMISNILYASVVSDNDGSAFITKAEFDSLKNNFQSQIDQYNNQIDTKIDNAIASYLSGISVSKESEINTSFNIIGNATTNSEGVSESTVHFMGKDYMLQYATLRPVSTTNLSWIGTIGYQAIEQYYMDSNNTLQITGSYTYGNTNNCVLESDDGYVEQFLKNVKVDENRNMVCQGRDNGIFYTGGIWKKVDMEVMSEPTEAQVSSWTTTTSAPIISVWTEGYGYNPNDWAQTNYGWTKLSRQLYYRRDEIRDAYVGSGAPTLHWLFTDYNINYVYDSTLNANYHWSFGSNNNFMVKEKVKDSSGNETKKGHYLWLSSVEWTKSRPFSVATGLGIYALKQGISGIANITTSNITIRGKYPTLNCNLKSPSNYKYKRIKTIWNMDTGLTNGLLLVDGSKLSDGNIEIQFKSNLNNTWLYFKNGSFTNKPNENDNSNLECEIFDETTQMYNKTYNPKLINNGTIYKIKIPTEKGKNIYVATSVNNSDSGFDVELSQVGTAKLITK